MNKKAVKKGFVPYIFMFLFMATMLFALNLGGTKVNELSYKDLKDVCNPNMFKFDKIKEVADTTNLVYGQDRGIKALEFGVNVDLKGYNL